MPRVVTMIASATEIVCALGCESDLVARSHECDYPASIARLPVCTSPRFDVHGSSDEIDQRVKTLVQEEVSIYRVDAEMLHALEPDVIITQAHCEVCAVSEKDVERALAFLPSPHRGRGVGGEGAAPLQGTGSLATPIGQAPSIGNAPSSPAPLPRRGEGSRNDVPSPPSPGPQWGEGSRRPTVVSLSPNNLADVWTSIRNVADALGVSSRGDTLVRELQQRVERFARHPFAQRPTVACLEWLEPLMAAGNWVPELVELAGGRNLFGQAGKHSPWMTMAELRERDPDIIVALPCGFDLAKTRVEMANLRKQPGWGELKAVQCGKVFVTDGNQFFNRPGPRLVESLEILAEIFHPDVFQFGQMGTGWEHYPPLAA